MATKSGLERQPITNGVVDRVTFQFYSEEEVCRNQSFKEPPPPPPPPGCASCVDRCRWLVLLHPLYTICTPYTPHSIPQLLRLSVKEIINPILFDELNNPQRGGLYDLALGPYEPKQQCATCGLGFLQCPGHFGHIKLAVPTYHPLVFRWVVLMWLWWWWCGSGGCLWICTLFAYMQPYTYTHA